MVFMSRQFPSHSRTGIPLHSLNVLVLLVLWQGARSCIKIYPICGNTTRSHNISISWIILLWYFAPVMLQFIISLKGDASAAIWLYRLAHLLAILQQPEYT